MLPASASACRQPLACLFCGQPELAELVEVWGPREFMVETCCPGMHEAVNEFLAKDPKAAAAWLSGLSDGILQHVHGPGVRRVIDAGGQLVLDWNLHTAPVAWSDAKRFVADHHRHCPPPAGWRFGTGLRNGPGIDSLIGVVIVGRPVARALDQKRVVEVNRLCIRDDISRDLVWNACSMGYAWASKQARKRGFQRIVTYTLESEDGTSLRAAGWVPEAKTRGGTWNCPSRPREDKTSTEPKVRWSPAWCAGAGVVAGAAASSRVAPRARSTAPGRSAGLGVSSVDIPSCL